MWIFPIKWIRIMSNERIFSKFSKQFQNIFKTFKTFKTFKIFKTLIFSKTLNFFKMFNFFKTFKIFKTFYFIFFFSNIESFEKNWKNWKKSWMFWKKLKVLENVKKLKTDLKLIWTCMIRPVLVPSTSLLDLLDFVSLFLCFILSNCNVTHIRNLRNIVLY